MDGVYEKKIVSGLSKESVFHNNADSKRSKRIAKVIGKYSFTYSELPVSHLTKINYNFFYKIEYRIY